jgi:hypothetical protein
MQIFRPESTLLTRNPWTGVGSAELWACLDEASPGDADFIYCANATSGYVSFALSLPAFHPPAGTCTLRWREACADSDAVTKAPASGGTVPQVWVQIYRSSTLVASFGPIAATQGGWTTREHSFDSTPITSWAVVSVRVVVSAGGSSRARPDLPPFRAGAGSWDMGPAGELVSAEFFAPPEAGDPAEPLRGVAVSWLELEVPGGNRRVLIM